MMPKCTIKREIIKKPFSGQQKWPSVQCAAPHKLMQHKSEFVAYDNGGQIAKIQWTSGSQMTHNDS